MLALPPTGKLLFVRSFEDEIGRAPWGGYMLSKGAANARDAAAVRATGAPLWMFDGPASFTASTWREGLAALERRAREVGATGIVPDAEYGWDGQRAEALAMADECRAIVSRGLRVCFTSYPHWPYVESFAARSNGDVSACVQIYGLGATDAPTFAAWLAKWRAAFGIGQTGVAFSLMSRGAAQTDFAGYIANMPTGVPFVAGWPDTSISNARRAVVEAWNPTFGKLGETVLSGIALLEKREVLAVVLAVLIALAVVWSI